MNILVLDEPGNHLDVETVETLAEALLEYKGTVLFTSHDRHFVRRIATNVIEVRDGRVRNYSGSYEDYLYYVNREIEDGERQRAAATGSAVAATASAAGPAVSGKAQHQLRKTLRNLEKNISRLDEQRKELDARMQKTADVNEAMKLHTQLEEVRAELAEAEERWVEIQEELGEW